MAHSSSSTARRTASELRTPTMEAFVLRALRPEDFYHTGIIVPDLDAAMARTNERESN